jgi:hypothetical protein
VNYIIIVSKLIKTIHNMNLKSDSNILIYLNTKYYKYNQYIINVKLYLENKPHTKRTIS